MVRKWLLPSIAVGLVAGCAVRKEPAPEPTPRQQASQVEAGCELDFPTQDRVEYVFECMRDHGGIHYDNLYHCVCQVDYLDRHLDAETFTRALTFKRYKALPGERGGIFRDPPEARKLRKRLETLERQAEAHCFPQTIVPKRVE